jgi:hypothetical protein
MSGVLPNKYCCACAALGCTVLFRLNRNIERSKDENLGFRVYPAAKKQKH